MTENRFYATGKRKSAIARIYMKEGTGVLQVNKRNFDDYFTRESLKMLIQQPLEITGKKGLLDFYINVDGGVAGQAGAIKHGISKALVEYDSGVEGGLEKGRFPDEGLPCQGKEKIRSAGSPEAVPVLQEIISPGRR